MSVQKMGKLSLEGKRKVATFVMAKANKVIEKRNNALYSMIKDMIPGGVAFRVEDHLETAVTYEKVAQILRAEKTIELLEKSEDNVSNVWDNLHIVIDKSTTHLTGISDTGVSTPHGPWTSCSSNVVTSLVKTFECNAHRLAIAIANELIERIKLEFEPESETEGE